METIPMPIPPMIRYTTNSLKDADKAHPMAEAENRIAERIMVFFRPALSLRTPAQATPPMEPTNAQPTYHPSCRVVNPNCWDTCAMVPEITAVSYPNRKPPKAATIDRNRIYPIFVFDSLISVYYLISKYSL